MKIIFNSWYLVQIYLERNPDQQIRNVKFLYHLPHLNIPTKIEVEFEPLTIPV